MQESATVEVRKPKNEWKKPTFSKRVRAMNIGDFIEVPKDYSTRQSRYVNAKQSFPGAAFSLRKQENGRFHLIRIS